MIRNLIIYAALAVLSLAHSVQSQNLEGFDRASFGSVVLSRTQAVGADIQLESAVGLYNNEPIRNYGSDSVFAQIGKSVGRLDVLTDKGNIPCTAFIVSKKHILTNYHCSFGMLDNERVGATRIDAVQFVAGYTQTGIDEGTKKYTVIPTPVEFSAELDYAVLEVLGNPSQEYGKLKLVSTVPNDRAPFWVIGHPRGEGQRISREKCRASSPAVSKTKLLHTCDTLPGNSGSPVIDAGLQVVVALHHAGISNDSVNAAILMSKILENSDVLAAYRAPNAVPKAEPKPIKTVEITACDALYSAAAEAKACFAYEAYFKSCRDHSLGPIAEGYINEFCQVEETVKVDEAPKTTVVKKTCSKADPGVCSNYELCDFATTNSTQKIWEEYSGYQTYVKEAKRRGLSCGVSPCTESNAEACKDSKLCDLASYINPESVKTWHYEFWRKFAVKEAKKRGLDCGVADATQLTKKLLIKSIQKELNRIGCVAGPADGIWGRQTQAAAVKFGKIAGLSTSKESLLSKIFLKKLSEANKNFCPTPKYVGVKSFAKIYDVYCGDFLTDSFSRTGEVNLKNKTVIMTNPDRTALMTWSGNILIDEDGDKARMKFDKNGFVYEIIILKEIEHSCGAVILKAK